jgi:hypothetical protein
MKILAYQNGGAQHLGTLAADGEHVIDLTPVIPDASTLLEGGERAADAARQHFADADPETGLALNKVTLCAPVPRPNSIRETMTFETHIIDVIRLRLGPSPASTSASPESSAPAARSPACSTGPSRRDRPTTRPTGAPSWEPTLRYISPDTPSSSTTSSNGGVHRQAGHRYPGRAHRRARRGLRRLQRLLRSRHPSPRDGRPHGTGQGQGLRHRQRDRPLARHPRRGQGPLQLDRYSPRQRRGMVSRQHRRYQLSVRGAHRLHVALRNALPRRLHRLGHHLRTSRQGLRPRTRPVPQPRDIIELEVEQVGVLRNRIV